MNQPPMFNNQFFDDDGTPLEGGFLYTYAAGTTTPQATYEDQAGGATNTNPIVLDAAGRCDLWLDPDLEYTFVLQRADETLVKTWDDVVGVASASSAVTSVNDLTGAVELTAEEIPFTTGTATVWFAGTDVAAALDDIITKVNDVSTGSTTAADVAIVDGGGYFTASNVETALQELASEAEAASLPTQTGNSGKFLTTNGTAASWATVALATFTASIAGGDISTSVSFGAQNYGSRTCTATGGTAPYTYFWTIQTIGRAPVVYTTAVPTTATVTFAGSADGITIDASALCIVTDATGRVTTATVGISAVHSASA